MYTNDKFWQVHAQEMRRARLLQAAATIHAQDYGASKEHSAIVRSIEVALELERVLKMLDYKEKAFDAGRDQAQVGN